MRKSWVVISLVVLLAVGFTGCGKKGEEAKAPEPQKPAYSTYTSDTDTFSIEIPEGLKVEKSTSEIDTALGKMPFSTYTAEGQDKVYMIGELQHPYKPGVDIKKVLAASKGGMLKGNELIKEWETEINGKFALALRFVKPSGAKKSMWRPEY